ncbi:MAG: 6,7-dimethyl-8-ribityllumazine synthase [Bacteroidales bacterium]
MATRDLSDYDPTAVPDAKKLRFGIIVSDWNQDVTFSLLKGATETLTRHGVSENDILVTHVPGSFELTHGAMMVAENEKVDAVICLGCVIQGETPHFTYICEGVAYGLSRLNIEYDIPFIFGVLTTNTMQQAIDRSGGIHGNKGDEAAVTAIKMAAMSKKYRKQVYLSTLRTKATVK